MTTYGVTSQGFVLKRLNDIIADMTTALSAVSDPVTGETLILDLADENDPLVQLVHATADQLSVCWEQLEMAYNQFDPLKSSGVALSGLVQLNGMLRNLGESDNMLRLRQQQEIALTSNGQADSLRAAILDLAGVQFCRVFLNSTLVDPDSLGIPAKSVAVVVVGGGIIDIANTIFRKSPMGLGFHGNVSALVEDSVGIMYNIMFQRPVEVPITVEVDISVIDSSWPTNGVTLVQEALVAYAQYGIYPNVGLPPGTDVLVSRMYTPINLVPGHKITAIRVGRNGGTTGVYDIPIQWYEVAQFSMPNILVTVG